MKIIICLIIICVNFILISCYTIIETPSKNIHSVYNNHLVVGVWESKFLMKSNLSDGHGNFVSTWITQRLDFFNDGNLVFYPHWEKIDSKVYHGTFTIIDNTLMIKLFNTAEEFYSFKADKNNLFLKKKETKNRSNYILPGNNLTKWVRIK